MMSQAINLDFAEAEILDGVPTAFDELVDERDREAVAQDLRRIARVRQEAATDGAPVRMS
jgi:hypothetical protein